jgi:hypothetical protein
LVPKGRLIHFPFGPLSETSELATFTFTLTNYPFGAQSSRLMAALEKGPRSKVQWSQAFLLVKSFKLVPRPLDKGPKPRQSKLWF